MAAHSVTKSKTATLAASTVDTVTITGQIGAVEVAHHGNTSDPLYVLIGLAVAAPTVAGDNCEVVLSGERIAFPTPLSSQGNTVVSIISAGATTVSVIAVP